MLNTYCYIHSSFIVPSTKVEDDNMIYKFPGVGPYHEEKQKDDLVFQTYYQWVSLLLLLQVSISSTFYLHLFCTKVLC